MIADNVQTIDYGASNLTITSHSILSYTNWQLGDVAELGRVIDVSDDIIAKMTAYSLNRTAYKVVAPYVVDGE